MATFWEMLLTLLTLICSLMSICNFSYFPFRSEGRIWVLIVSVSGHCLVVTFISHEINILKFGCIPFYIGHIGHSLTCMYDYF